MTGETRGRAPAVGVTITEVIAISVHAEEGARIMIVTVPPRVKSFCERFRETLTEKRRTALAWMLAGLLLTRGKRSQSGLARAVRPTSCSPKWNVPECFERARGGWISHEYRGPCPGGRGSPFASSRCRRP